jgi:hypothetical protein
MPLLKERVQTIICPSNYNNTYDNLLRRLKEMGFEIMEQKKERGKIIIRCLTSLMNMIFWECWGDRVLFEIKQIEQNKTKVTIFAMLSLLRIKVGKKEKRVDLDKLISELKSIIPTN